MGENSKIEWTDHTFNPWIGCTKVAAGCAHCYAEAMAKRTGKAVWGPQGTRVMTSPKYWQQPIEWNKRAVVWPLHEELCRLSGVKNPILEWERRDNGQLPDPELMRRPRVFCASMADVFEDWDGPMLDHHGCGLYVCSMGCGKLIDGAKPSVQGAIGPYCRPCEKHTTSATMGDVRRELFKLIDATPYLDWILLTKRPENILRMWPSRFAPHPQADLREDALNDVRLDWNRPNVWLLTSIAEQKDADANVFELIKCRDLAPVLGLSCEPLVGPVDLNRTHENDLSLPRFIECVDWVIAGGESGHGARPMHPDWPRQIRDQCQGAGVPFFFKQWGEWLHITMVDDKRLYRSNRKAKQHESQEAIDESYGRHCIIPTRGVQFDGGDGFRMIDGRHGYQTFKVGKKAAGRLLDGREWNQFPKPLVPSP